MKRQDSQNCLVEMQLFFGIYVFPWIVIVWL